MCDYPKRVLSINFNCKDDGFSYHSAKRIIEEDIFGAGIHCTCQCNSVMGHMSTWTMSNVESYLPSFLTT